MTAHRGGQCRGERRLDAQRRLDFLGQALRCLAERAGIHAIGAATGRVCDHRGTLGISLVPDGDSVVVEVADTGSGVRDGARERVFDLFFTTRREGSGVGLPTVKKIVELQGGRISLACSDSAGSLFRVVLPRAS